MEEVSEKQLELEALSLLFNPEEYTVDGNVVKIKIEVDEFLGTICFTLPEDYPKMPPKVDITLENEPKNRKTLLGPPLEKIVEKSISSNLGYPCIFSTIEDIKQFIASGRHFAHGDNRDGAVNSTVQNSVTYEQFMDWTDNFINKLIERGDLPPNKNDGKLTGKEIFEKSLIAPKDDEEFSECLYTNSPEISDFEDDAELLTNCLE